MKLLYDAPLPSESIAEIRRRFPDLTLIATPPATPRELLADADVLYTQVADFDPADAPKLRWVQTNSASIQSLWGKPVMRTEMPVCNVTGAYSIAVAECAMAILLAMTRKIPQGVDWQRAHRWPADDGYDAWRGVDLYGMTMGIVGYGSIGRQIARLAKSFGTTILACKRHPQIRRDDSWLLPDTGDPEGLLPAAWYGADEMATMFARSDAVVVTLPQTPHTIGLVGARELAALPPHAWLVNIGRGAVIDEPALIDILQQGKIAGAGLDVVTDEPLAADSPLWDLPNVLIMPHVGSWTQKQPVRAAEVLIENLRRNRAGEPLVNVIDKELLY